VVQLYETTGVKVQSLEMSVSNHNDNHRPCINRVYMHCGSITTTSCNHLPQFMPQAERW